MSATKEYYAEINEKYTYDQLRQKGWSDKRIRWLRYCFGPGADSDGLKRTAILCSNEVLRILGWTWDEIWWLRDWFGSNTL